VLNKFIPDNDKSEQSPYRWDDYSDQPLPIRDKNYKRRIRMRAIPALIKLLLVNLLTFFPTLYRYFIEPRFNTGQVLESCIGLCVNLDKEPSLSPDLVRELGVNSLSLRIPLSDIDNIDAYVEFIESFDNVKWLFVVLQDREHIEKTGLLEKNLMRIFEKLSKFGNDFQIGNAINRTKWGFVSVDEYFSFYQTAQTVRDKHYPSLKLLGSAVIDFEIYALLRSLWHARKIFYDGVAALLYVDRRGAPESKQFIFDAVGKINFFWSSLLLSPLTKNRLVINEVNWPIENTRPYAPALDDVWVSEEDYSNYLLRYYLLALANARVECIYWHQLIAPGYGLIDNRDGVLRKRRAYYAFQTLIQFMDKAIIKSVFETPSHIQIFAKNGLGTPYSIQWALGQPFKARLPMGMSAIDAVGQKIPCVNGQLEIGSEPVYFV